MRRRTNRNAINLVPLSEIEPQPVNWLWPNVFLNQSLNLLVGAPSVGKSTLLAWMAAHVTTGTAWPDGSVSQQGSVVYLGLEEIETAESTLRPRVDAAGGDPSKFYFLSGQVHSSRSSDSGFATFLRRLQQAMKKVPDVRLVIIDPLTECLPRKSSFEAGVRANLGRLMQFARKRDICVIGVVHNAKATKKNPIHQVLGSIAYCAVPRVVQALAETSPERPTERALIPLKCNVASGRAHYFRLESSKINNLDVSLLVHQRSGALLPNWTPEDAKRLKASPAYDQAETVLRLILQKGPVLSLKVFSRAEELGIAKSTLRRVAKRIRVHHGHTATDRSHWYMSLSPDEQ